MDDILLMLPGPTTVDPRVLQAMAKDVVNHRGDEFGEIYTETTKLMSKTFQTKNDSYIITGSGTAAMEAAQSAENSVKDLQTLPKCMEWNPKYWMSNGELQ